MLRPGAPAGPQTAISGARSSCGRVAWHWRVTGDDVERPEPQGPFDAEGAAQLVVGLDRGNAYAGVLEAVDRVGVESDQVGRDQCGGRQVGLRHRQEIGDVDAAAHQPQPRGALDLADRGCLPRCTTRGEDDVHQDTLTRVT